MSLHVCHRCERGDDFSKRGSPAVRQVRTQRYLSGMSAISNFVSLHPYFKVHPGKLEAVKAGYEEMRGSKRELRNARTIFPSIN